MDKSSPRRQKARMSNAPILLIPGPVQTDPRVKAAMAQDIAPWDPAFRAVYARVRERLVPIAGGVPGTHVCLPLPAGSGHLMLEATLRSFVAPGAKVLVPNNGDYGIRLLRLVRECGRVPVDLPIPEGEAATVEGVQAALAADPAITHVAVVYSETGSGVLNPVAAIARAAEALGRRIIIDAVSALGALPLAIAEHANCDAVVFTANKCLEGMPGLGLSVCPIARVKDCIGGASSWCLDLSDVLRQTEERGFGSIRFTPAAQAIAALDVALDLLEAEGGPGARLARYEANTSVLHEGFASIGLVPYLPRAKQGPVIVNALQPVADPNWELQAFVRALRARGFVMSNFSSTAVPTIRIAAIGANTPEVMRRAIAALGGALDDIGVRQRAAA
jgi:2-aminoethylphosphonate-pyruvate transaminase